MTRICDNKDDKSVPTGSRAACCLVQKTVQVCNLDNYQLNTHCFEICATFAYSFTFTDC